VARWEAAYRRYQARPELDLPILHDVILAHRHAFAAYEPGAYPGRVTLFRATERLAGVDPARGWHELVGVLEVHDVPGDHYTAITEPRIRCLAERLKDCLDHLRSGAREGQSS
jgi:thioesterase domain-containing protein